MPSCGDAAWIFELSIATSLPQMPGSMVTCVGGNLCLRIHKWLAQ